MSTFKVGDEVICIDGKDKLKIQTGGVYTIKRVVDNFVTLEGVDSEYYANRFELYTAPTGMPIEPPKETEMVDPLIEQRRELKRMLGGI